MCIRGVFMFNYTILLLLLCPILGFVGGYVHERLRDHFSIITLTLETGRKVKYQVKKIRTTMGIFYKGFDTVTGTTKVGSTKKEVIELMTMVLSKHA